MATSIWDYMGDGRGGTEDRMAKLSADKAAANQYGTDAASARGEVYTPLPDVLNNPYGGVRTSSGSSYGGTGTGPAPGMTAGNNVVTSTGQGGGDINLSRGSYEEQQMLAMRAKLNDDAFAKRIAALQSVGVGTPGATVSGQGGPMGDETAARNAAFARAKDRAGSTALASLTALQNVMANRGMSGSTEEARGMANSLQGGAGIINDFTRDELMTDLNRAADIGDRNYQGAITQRGQDMGAKQSLLALINSASSGLY